MSRPVVLDLFCGAGGASAGYYYAGFDVIGVDINYQRHYPFEFYQGDALTVGPELLRTRRIDLIHASPPCQAYSDLQKRTGRDYPELIEPTRRILVDSNKPYVIENVDRAPLENPVLLCGRMFPGLRVYRHRLFETNFPLRAPHHPKHDKKVYTYDRRKAHFGRDLTDDMFVQVTGGGNAPHHIKLQAMGINWPMTRKEVNEAIPPIYAWYVGCFAAKFLVDQNFE